MTLKTYLVEHENTYDPSVVKTPEVDGLKLVIPQFVEMMKKRG